jgi:hypothetical protein
MTAVIDWNGKDLPTNLQSLPPGRYVVENLDEADDLSSEQEEGIRAALHAIDEGKAIPADEVDAEIGDLLR